MVLIAVLALVLVNLWTLRSFREDKGRAIAGKRRIPERRLLELALIGGTPAAFLSRHLFRHKTRKQPFTTYLQLIAMIQVGVIAGIAWVTFA